MLELDKQTTNLAIPLEACCFEAMAAAKFHWLIAFIAAANIRLNVVV